MVSRSWRDIFHSYTFISLTVSYSICVDTISSGLYLPWWPVLTTLSGEGSNNPLSTALALFFSFSVVNAFTYFLVALLGIKHLFDRVDRKWVLLSGNLMNAISCVCGALAKTKIEILAISRIVQGAASVIVWTVGIDMLNIIPLDRHPLMTSYGIIFLGHVIGEISSPLIGSLYEVSSHIPFTVTGCLLTLSILFALLVKDFKEGNEEPQTPTEGHPTQSTSDHANSKGKVNQKEYTILSTWNRLGYAGSLGFYTLCALTFYFALLRSFFEITMPIYCFHYLKVHIYQTGLMFFAFSLTYVVASLASKSMTDSGTSPLTLIFLGLLIGVAVLPLTTRQVEYFWMLVLMCIFAGAMAFTMIGTGKVVAQLGSTFSNAGHNALILFHNFIWNLGCIVGPIIGGVVGRYSAEVQLITLSVFGVIGILFIPILGFSFRKLIFGTPNLDKADTEGDDQTPTNEILLQDQETTTNPSYPRSYSPKLHHNNHEPKSDSLENKKGDLNLIIDDYDSTITQTTPYSSFV